MRKVLMVGRFKAFVIGLERGDSDIELYVLEEPEIRQRWQSKPPLASSILKGVRSGAYQQSTELLPIGLEWHSEVGFDAVIAGVEYAVGAAAALAERLGLPHIGSRAAAGLTNKLRLRRLCQSAGIPQPAFAQLSSLDDIRSFASACGGPFVLKPANLQASSGVIRVDSLEAAESAYVELLSVRDAQLVSRAMSCDYLVEEYVAGTEVSVETIVSGGTPVFENVTGKLTTEGRYFVELGHVVPAQIQHDVERELRACQQQLIRALAVQHGIVHAEWKLTEDGPRLIECAGRAPGDNIMELIEHAYGFNPYLAVARVLAGEALALPSQPRQAACIRFFSPPPGRLAEVSGIDVLESGAAGVVDWSLTVKPGDVIHPLTSSWARVGYVTSVGSVAAEAERRAANALAPVNFRFED